MKLQINLNSILLTKANKGPQTEGKYIEIFTYNHITHT